MIALSDSSACAPAIATMRRNGDDGLQRMPAYRLGTAGRFMTRELGWFVALGIIALSVPIIIISLRLHLPSFALPFDRLWTMAYAIGCMILAHTMPEITGMVIVAVYARYIGDGALSTLFAAGRSPLAVALPGGIVAFLVLLLVLANALVVAPGSARYIHDTLLFLRRDFNLNLLETGVFHEFRNENATIFFRKKFDKANVEDVVIVQRFPQGNARGNKEEMYLARRAIVAGAEGDRALLLIDGIALLTRLEAARVRKVDFERAFWKPDFGFGAQDRSNLFLDEIGTADLLLNGPDPSSRRRTWPLWLREVVWRFIAPLLTLTHAMFGLGLLFSLSPISGRDRTPYLVGVAASGVILALHIGFMTLLELIGRSGLPGAVLFGGLVAAEGAAGFVLVRYSQNPYLRRQASRWSAFLSSLLDGGRSASPAGK